jgi:hypothetical protein
MAKLPNILRKVVLGVAFIDYLSIKYALSGVVFGKFWGVIYEKTCEVCYGSKKDV